MNLLRILLIALAVWIVIILVRNARQGKQVRDKRPRDKVENMVECATCGVHLPEKEAICEGDTFFCCEAHRRQAGE